MKPHPNFAIISVCVIVAIAIVLSTIGRLDFVFTGNSRVEKSRLQTDGGTKATTDLQDYTAQVTPVTNPRDAENVPVYPSAENVQRQRSQFLNQPDELAYYTDASMEQVVEFYSAVLPKIDWLSTPARSSYGDMMLFFTWPDGDGTLPYRLVMNITISNTCFADAYIKGGKHTAVNKRCIGVVLFRTPYASRIPLYSGATDIRTSTEPTDRATFISKTTQYSIHAAPAEVEAFYLSEMQKNGWVLESALEPKRENESIQTGIVFVDPTTPPNETEPPKAVINADIDAGSEISVKIVARGPELKETNP